MSKTNGVHREQRNNLSTWAAAALVIATSTGVAGCTIWAVPSTKLDTNKAIMVEGGKNRESPIRTLQDAHDAVDGLYAIATDQSKWRMVADHSADDATFYGTLLAVIGVTTGGIAARNIGAGVAGLSTTVSGHYQFSQQRVAFDRAAARARCLQEALNDIDDKSLSLFDNKALGKVGADPKTAVDADDALSRVPDETSKAVHNIVKALRQDLIQLSAPTGSLDDIRALAMKVDAAAKAAADASSKAGTNSSTAQQAVTQATTALESAAGAVSTVSADVQKTAPGITANNLAEYLNATKALGSPTPEAFHIDTESLNRLREQGLLERFRMANEMKLNAAATQQEAKLAYDASPYTKQRFLAAVVQYQASAEACVALGAAATH